MTLREPSIVERHVATHLLPYAALCGVVGALMLARGIGHLGSDVVLAAIELVLGAWVAAGPWLSRRLVTRWDAGER